MDFIKNVGFGAQIAVVSGYLAAVKGHNVVESVKALGGINKEHLKDINNYKHVAGRVFQTPLFLVGMAIGIVADLLSGVVNGLSYVFQHSYNAVAASKAKVTKVAAEDKDYFKPNLAELHKNFVDPKNVDATVEHETAPIAENVSMFNGHVAQKANEVCQAIATKLTGK